jgi:hypothetical protein
MQFDHDGEWSDALGLVDTRHQWGVSMPEIFYIRDFNFIGLRAGSHAGLLLLLCWALGIVSA